MKNKLPIILFNVALFFGLMYLLSLNASKEIEVPVVSVKEVKRTVVEEVKPVEEVVVETKPEESQPTLTTDEDLKQYLQMQQSQLEDKLEEKLYFNSDKFKFFMLQQQTKLQELLQKQQLSSLENQIESMKKAKLIEEQEKALEEIVSRQYMMNNKAAIVSPKPVETKKEENVKLELEIKFPEIKDLPKPKEAPVAPTPKVESKEEPQEMVSDPSIEQRESVGSKLSKLVAMMQSAFDKKEEPLPQPKQSEDYILAHKKLLEKAKEEKIGEKALAIFDKLSQDQGSLKSRDIKEIEIVKKEDSYNKISDFLLNTGDRYIVVSVSFPKEPSPYSSTGSSYEVDVKVLDANEEVLSFHVSYEGKTKEWSEIDLQSYVPGEWVKVLKGLK